MHPQEPDERQELLELQELLAREDVRLCPLTKQLMQDPYYCGDGRTYERSALVHRLRQIESSGVRLHSPLDASAPLPHGRLLPDVEIRSLIASRVTNVCELDPATVRASDRVLGRGAWGVVRMGQLSRPSGQEDVAIKSLPETTREEEREMLRRELIVATV